jgi:lysophospholipid acyltransferase (LPLAT)-like uncharacterized protein
MSSFRDTLNGNTLYLLSQLVRRTGRFQITGFTHLEEAQTAGRPIIFVAWHGMTMMLVGFFNDHFDFNSIVLIVPDDWRGAALSIFASKLGATPFPMNLKGEGGMATARRLARLVRRVSKGDNCYITPDGPDGPAYAIKPGVTYIAQRANAIMLPLGAYARHGYRLNRWDQYVVPYPYSRISVNVGPPIKSPDEGEDLQLISGRLTDALHRVTAQAAANYYELNT